MRHLMSTVVCCVVFMGMVAGTNAVAQRGRSLGPSGHGATGKAANASSSSSSKNISTRLSDNKQLASKLEGLLGLSGPNALTALQGDASGFKNLGQFVAAVHVSNNLGIPFSTLRTDMVTKRWSLGKSIQAADPKVSAKAEAKKAQKQANADLKLS